MLSIPCAAVRGPVLIFFLLVLSAYSAAEAASLQVLHRFCTSCAEGDWPQGLVTDSAGNLFGVAREGGDVGDCPLDQTGCGTVFELARDGKRWSYRVLHTFCALASCADGGAPLGNLIVDKKGNLYGTTSRLGSGDAGTIYELKGEPDGTWTFVLLYTFCAAGGGCPDGSGPTGGLTYKAAGQRDPYDGRASLFGVTRGGGAANHGAIFELDKPNAQPTERTLYSFCSRANCRDGSLPYASVVSDSAGDLYGTTSSGGEADGGEVYVLRHRKLEVLHSFCSVPACVDGQFPQAGVTLDGAGDIYGAAWVGGGANKGTLYELARVGDSYNFSVLYSFCQLRSCADGQNPVGAVALDDSGSVFGSTSEGGKFNQGVLFAWSGTFNKLYDFCRKKNCSDGADPQAALIGDASGNLYGTTVSGGIGFGGGVVFELTP
jgi:uncharacterized repeat protein (TIGR03803 family)